MHVMNAGMTFNMVQVSLPVTGHASNCSEALSKGHIQVTEQLRGTPEVRGLLRFPDRLHEHVLDHHVDVRAREALRLLPQHLKVGLRQRVRRVAQVHLEHVRPRRQLRERDVDSLHSPSTTVRRAHTLMEAAGA